MNMKRINLALAVIFMSASVSFGQNFNPTVEVTNTYHGNPSEAHKPLLEMNVPDSLLRFDLDFDYEVFNKPYQGAYSFKPYMLDMRPAKDAWRGRKLFLKAGAGYSFHPQLDFVFSPELRGPFQMSVYASHRSYFGNYHRISPVLGEDEIFRLKEADEHFSGHDALTSAGFDGLYCWDKAILSFGVGYYGLAAKDTVMSRSYNALDFNARVRSNNDSESYFLYDIGIKGRVANDGLDYESFSFPSGVETDKQNESWVFMDGLAGLVKDSRRSILAGFEAESASYSGFYKGSIGRVALIPTYRLKSGRWNLDLGVRFEYVFRNDDKDYFRAMTGDVGQIVYPDAHVSFAAGESVSLYADATGGSRLNTYSSQISGNHHLNHTFLDAPVYEALTPLIDNTVENVNAKIGVRGNVASMLQFDVNGGIGVYGNALMDYGYFGTSERFMPSLTYSDINLIYANVLLGWKSSRVKVDADLRYRSVSFPGKDVKNRGFALPKYSGGLRATYNLSSRLYAGVAVEASSWRESQCEFEGDDLKVRVPGYVDLGLNCGYKFNRKLELWLESGNLLCQTIQRNPFYAEKGLWITAGVSLSL